MFQIFSFAWAKYFDYIITIFIGTCKNIAHKFGLNQHLLMGLEFSTILGVKNTISRLHFQIRIHIPLKDGNAIFVHQPVRHREVPQEISWNNLKCNET